VFLDRNTLVESGRIARGKVQDLKVTLATNPRSFARVIVRESEPTN